MSSTMQNKASLPVIKRLPKYYRYLTNLSADGKDKISSSELAHMMGTTASQVRQDFNCFGGFGQQGIGYKVDVLLTEIGKLLFGNGELLPTVLCWFSLLVFPSIIANYFHIVKFCAA